MHLFEAASTADARRAAEMLVRAGRRALDRLAYEDAAERFDRALQALELAGAEDDAGPVLLARGDALLRAGEPEAARAAFTAARALALRRDDDALLGEAALGFAGLGIAIVDLDAEAIARLEEALERAEDRPRCAPGSKRASRSSSTTRPTAHGQTATAPMRSPPPARQATRARSPPR